MNDPPSDPQVPPELPLSPEELGALRAVVSFLETELPPRYRRPAFLRMLERVLRVHGGRPVAAVAAEPPPPGSPEGRARHADPEIGTEPPVEPHQADLERYRELLESRGKILHKALATLEVGASQLATPWMTPAEIEGFLREVAGISTAYRSNISGALSGAGVVTQRRRMGRGYEYRLSRQGAAVLERAVRGSKLD